jgi:hypothetical protein
MKKYPTLATAPRTTFRAVSERYMRMPWGRHKGKWLSEVPTDYLKWCLLNYQNELGLLEVIKDEVVRREPGLRTRRAK